MTSAGMAAVGIDSSRSPALAWALGVAGAVACGSADALGEALAVGHELGHVHLPKPASM